MDVGELLSAYKRLLSIEQELCKDMPIRWGDKRLPAYYQAQANFYAQMPTTRDGFRVLVESMMAHYAEVIADEKGEAACEAGLLLEQALDEAEEGLAPEDARFLRDFLEPLMDKIDGVEVNEQ